MNRLRATHYVQLLIADDLSGWRSFHIRADRSDDVPAKVVTLVDDLA